jgi:RND family efflux transporter MFP subunit
MDWKKTLIICLGILFIGFTTIALIFTTEPTAQQSGATKQTAMLVDVVTVQKGNYKPIINATGTVRPSQDLSISPKVSGEVVKLSNSFKPGGFVKKGDLLLQIDKSDYEIELIEANAALQRAESELSLELGLQQTAKKEYQQLEDSISAENKSLVLREPQLKTVKANVDAARANVRRAELNLNRTSLTAPFDAHIVNRQVNIGSQVSPGNDLGWMVGQKTYWIEAAIPSSKLKWLTFPDSDSEGSEVIIRNRTSWGDGKSRTGFLFSSIGALQDQTRMARVLIEIEDPLAQAIENENLPALMIGAFVDVNISGEELSNVVRINRDYIRDNNTVWVMQNQKLEIRTADIIFKDAKYAYVTNGLQDNDRVVITNLSTVIDGVDLRLKEESELNKK